MRKLKAFTLVELLVVVVIIGILATLVVVSLQSASAKAKDAKTKTSIDAVATALQVAVGDGLTDLTTIKAACGAGNAADVSNVSPNTCQSAIGAFSSAPVDGLKSPIRVQITGSTTYKISGKSATGTTATPLCYQITDSDNSGIGSAPLAASCL